MARYMEHFTEVLPYKEYDYSQGKFIPIHFDKQIIPGTFEYTLHYLIDNEIDLSLFDTRYNNEKCNKWDSLTVLFNYKGKRNGRRKK